MTTKVDVKQVARCRHYDIVIMSVPNASHMIEYFTYVHICTCNHTKIYVATEYPAHDCINLLIADKKIRIFLPKLIDEHHYHPND